MTYASTYKNGENVIWNWLQSTVAQNIRRHNLDETFSIAQSYCKDCKTSSPMVCVERCDVWRVKNEILEINRIINEEGHGTRLLNAIRNARRLKILQALLEYPL